MKTNSPKQMARILLSAFLLTLTSLALALNYQVNYTSTPPTIDGTIDSAWSSASAAATGFVVYDNVGTLSTQQSSVRLLWNSEKLFVLFEANDDAIVASATGADTGFDFATPQDTAEILLDPRDAQSTDNNNFVYHIAVNPAANVYTYSEAGQDSLGWNPGSGSALAFGSTGTNWRIEMAIAWTELNSTLTSSPGVVLGPPGNGSVWAVQFGRLHSAGNNTVASKWEPTASFFRTRPFGTLTFTGGPATSPALINTSAPLFATGFEAPTYTADSTVVGIEGWASGATASNLIATSSAFKSGAQSLEIKGVSGQTLVCPTLTSPASGQYNIQYAFKAPSEQGTADGYVHVLYLNAQHGITSAAGDGQIWFHARPLRAGTVRAGGNNISAYSCETPSDETLVTSYEFPGIQTRDDWSYLNVKVDETAKSYEVWYNGLKLTPAVGSGSYSFKNKTTMTKFNSVTLYSKSIGTASVFVDDFGIYAVPPASVTDWPLY